LLAQRWDADDSLGSWNLAKLGVEQRKELPEDAWNNLKRVKMKFDTLEGRSCPPRFHVKKMLRVLDRHLFSGKPCSCKPLMHHDLSRCIMARHHGVFGIIKQIGSQSLRNYHQARDEAAARSIELGPLLERES
jgi:hypothetical protein